MEIKEDASLVTLKLWPNPTSERIHIEGLSPLYGEEVQVSITDIFGKIKVNSMIQISNSRIEINVNHLVAGYYVIDFTFNNQHQSIPFIKH